MTFYEKCKYFIEKTEQDHLTVLLSQPKENERFYEELFGLLQSNNFEWATLSYNDEIILGIREPEPTTPAYNIHGYTTIVPDKDGNYTLMQISNALDGIISVMQRDGLIE